MIKYLEKNYKISFVILFIITFFIFLVSSLEFKQTFHKKIQFSSFVYHFLIFFIFELFLMIFLVQGKNKRQGFLFLSFVVGIFYSILDEIHQFFVKGRFCSLEDFLINSFGILTALLIYSIRLKLYEKKFMQHQKLF